MSGGSREYFYLRLETELRERPFEDRWLNELCTDFVKVFKEEEWFKSGDTCREDFEKARDAFVRKWLMPEGMRTFRLISLDAAIKDAVVTAKRWGKDEITLEFNLIVQNGKIFTVPFLTGNRVTMSVRVV